MRLPAAVLLSAYELVACSGAADENSGTPGVNSLVKLTPVSPGPTCAYGGTEVDVGSDLDGNNVLDANEVRSTEVICGASAQAVSVKPSTQLVTNTDNDGIGSVICPTGTVITGGGCDCTLSPPPRSLVFSLSDHPKPASDDHLKTGQS